MNSEKNILVKVKQKSARCVCVRCSKKVRECVAAAAAHPFPATGQEQQDSITLRLCVSLSLILTPLAGTGKLYALPVNNWWSQIKTAGSAIYANRHYLALYKNAHPERLASAGLKTENDNANLVCNIVPDVHIHPTASVHPTATVSSGAFYAKDAFVTFNLEMFPLSSVLMFPSAQAW